MYVELGVGGEVGGIWNGLLWLVGVWFVMWRLLTAQCSGDEVSRGMQDGGGGGGGRGYMSSGQRRGGGRRYDEGDRRRRASSGNVVKVRGLPYDTGVQELSSFFQDYNVSAAGGPWYMALFHCRLKAGLSWLVL